MWVISSTGAWQFRCTYERHGSQRVLLGGLAQGSARADDEPLAREVLRDILEYCGALVVTVGSGREALERMRLIWPDILVMKVGLSGEDGPSLLTKAREMATGRESRVRAIAISVHEADRERSLAEGFKAHLTWPINPWELSRIIASLTLNP